MVGGYCIYAGYNSIPWDLGFRKAKEICFESRFMTAEECRAAGFVSRVFTPEDLERETCAFARRVAGNEAPAVRRPGRPRPARRAPRAERRVVRQLMRGVDGMRLLPQLGWLVGVP
jgi:enoyl-CoA hydratase/carnithine racemase